MSRRIRLKIHRPRRPLPDRVWKPQYGWGLSLFRIGDGERIVRTGGMNTREDALRERDEALATGRYSHAWIWEMTEPTKIVKLHAGRA